MKPEDEFRRLRDPNRWYPIQAATDPRSEPSMRRSSSRRRTTPIVATAVVALTLTVLTVAVLQARHVGGGAAAPLPSASSSGSPAPGTVAALPHVDGRLIATWTNGKPAPEGPFDLGGLSYSVTSACTGGGSILIAIPHHQEEGGGCQGVQVSGPSRSYSDGMSTAETEPIEMRVTTEGSPTYAVQLWAVPLTDEPKSEPWTIARTGAGVPASLRSCTAADFATTGTFTPYSHYEGGRVEVRSVAASDCAVRRWPMLRYLDAHGATVGPPAGQDLSSAEGSFDAHNRFPPARIPAGGTAYVTVTVFKADRLLDEKGCRAAVVTALRLGLAPGRTIAVPLSTGTERANCRNPDHEASGVDPVVSFRPGSP